MNKAEIKRQIDHIIEYKCCPSFYGSANLLRCDQCILNSLCSKYKNNNSAISWAKRIRDDNYSIDFLLFELLI